MSPGMTPSPIANGKASACPPKQNGRTPLAVAAIPSFPGEMRQQTPRGRTTPPVALALPPRSANICQMPTVFLTWLATFGSSRRTNGRPTRRKLAKNPQWAVIIFHQDFLFSVSPLGVSSAVEVGVALPSTCGSNIATAIRQTARSPASVFVAQNRQTKVPTVELFCVRQVYSGRIRAYTLGVVAMSGVFMYHYNAETALEELQEDALLPHPVKLRDMIF